jgi:hypothetical protein
MGTEVCRMNAPEKIYGWLDSQLSVARFYGGITFQGHSYVIDMNDPKQPLVRQDILDLEKKKKRKVKKLTLEKQNPNDDKTLELF